MLLYKKDICVIGEYANINNKHIGVAYFIIITENITLLVYWVLGRAKLKLHLTASISTDRLISQTHLLTWFGQRFGPNQAKRKQEKHPPDNFSLICHNVDLVGEESNYVTKAMFYPLWE